VNNTEHNISPNNKLRSFSADASEIERRQAAMDAHRRRLQEEHDQKSAEHAAKQAAVSIRCLEN